jgi:serine protease AprX
MNKREIPAHPPLVQEHHVRLPDQAAALLGAKSLHDKGITGAGVRVAVIDSGFFPHPFYTERGYRITHVPTHKERNPDVDEYGHGTAQLASLFSLAPGVEALTIKCMDRDPSYAVEKALELDPQVLSCAWGFNIDRGTGLKEVPREYRRLMKLIHKAVDSGITVVAAGGNGQHAFPGSMPEVIAAGGIYYGEDGNFSRSDVSSKFESVFFPGRHVPDLCGLVGNRPHGRLLLVPVPPRARLARRPSFSTIAAGDSSDVRHGWAMFSGTSAATAMISGAAALMLQVMPHLRPSQIKSALVEGSQWICNEKNNSPDILDSGDARLLNVEQALAVANRKYHAQGNN